MRRVARERSSDDAAGLPDVMAKRWPLITHSPLHGTREDRTFVIVIVSFGDATTEDVFDGNRTARVRGLPTDILTRAVNMLDRLNAAGALDDMRVPPANRLEKLKGDLSDFHSVRVNDQWRIIFKWTASGPAEVKLTDYH